MNLQAIDIYSYGSAICVVISFFGYGISAMSGPKDFISLVRLGLGTATPMTYIVDWRIPSSGVGGLFENALVANSPRPIFSFLYFTINGLFSGMLAASEWSKLETKRKGLRVYASPTGAQRSSYTLQLPYKYALPLILLSGLFIGSSRRVFYSSLSRVVSTMSKKYSMISMSAIT